MTGTVEFILCERGRKVDTRHVETVEANGAKRGLEIGRQHQLVPQCIVVTALRPDMVLSSEC